jgi:hypothetical protein
MQVGDGVMFFHIHMDTQVKIWCALMGSEIQRQQESPQMSLNVKNTL